MTYINVNNVSLKFRLYHDKSPSLKGTLASLFQARKEKGYEDFWALKDINLSVEAGERVGIVGHNGAGKSTLLKTICRIYEATQGDISVSGKIAPMLEIGAGFHPEFTGRENIFLNGSILGYNRQQLEMIQDEIIAFSELEDFIDTPVKYYSTGMYMRLAFSIATSIHPDILILDEMFVGGDAAFIAKGTKRMNAMIDRASIMMLVSHDSSLLEKLCDRIIWLDHGVIRADGGLNVIDEYKKHSL